MKVIIDNKIYICEKAKFDLSKFDHDGLCDKYKNISYIIIDDNDGAVIRQFERIYDENNMREAFDPYNHSSEDCIMVSLSQCDEYYMDELYQITATTNQTGEVFNKWLNKIVIHEDLKLLPNIGDTIEANDVSTQSKILKIKNDYIKLEAKFEKLRIINRNLAKSVDKILEAETDIIKRKEIIDFVYENKVEELHEYTMRKIYLLGEK